MNNSILFFASMLLLINGLSAQNNQDTTEDNTIKGQFETLVRKSTNYRQGGKRYEVVRLIELEAFQKNILDTITVANSNIAELQATIAENETALSSLNTKLDETTKNLKTQTEEKDSITFFGVLISEK